MSGPGVSPKRWWRTLRRAARPQLRLADGLIVRANAARDAGHYREAAVLYREALRLVRKRPDIAIQAGHMFKEARDFGAAELHYRVAERELPHDADLQHQLGHFFKTIDRLELAEAHYRRAADLSPDWVDPRMELATLRSNRILPESPADPAPAEELVSRAIVASARSRLDEIRIRSLGGRPTMLGGEKVPVLAGIEAVHGICLSDRRIETAAIYLDSVLFHSEAIVAGPTDDPAILKAVFNLWIDFSDVAPGLTRFEIVLTDDGGMTRRHAQPVLIEPPRLPTSDVLASDAAVFVEAVPSRLLEAEIRRQPSVLRPVSCRLLEAPQTILVLRTDQLGDMVVSIPAIRRLRRHFPTAKLVGLLTSANIDLARTLKLFDEVIIAEFPDDMQRRQRIMTPADQRDLEARLREYHFDVAIDLASSNMSRPLLKLTGADLTFGFDDDNCPWVDGGITGNVRDAYNRGERLPQSGRIVALVDRLATVFETGATILPNAAAAPSGLSHIGIADGERFVLLHVGARVAFSRWRDYPELARRLIAQRDVKVVVLGSEIGMRAALSDLGANADRLVVIDQHLPFEDLDLLLSRAMVFVGNDSGPKHLAALRGTPVVSIHCARISWAEWAQEQTGVVISRRVPCAGCAIFHETEECGKDFACVTDISVDEVLGAISGLLAGD